jgi:ankyrin repeat protein
LKALVKHGADLDKWVGTEKALHVVSATGHKELTSWLMDNGATVDSRTKNTGATPLMTAAKYGHAEAIAELLLHDADLQKQDVSHLSAAASQSVFYQ